MFSRFRIALALALLLTLMFTLPAFAGGWAVITLDEMPTNVVAGEPLTIGFTVLQHGQTPMTGLTPTVTATLAKAEQFVVDAEPDGKAGHYTATLTFPKEGDWQWSINAFTMDQPMPILRVAAPIAKVANLPVPAGEPATAPISSVLVVRVLAIGVGLAGLFVAYRRRSRLAIGLTVVCLLVGIGSFVTVPAVPAVEAQSQSFPKMVSEHSSISQVELGKQLFIAKGCITCHANNKIVRAFEYKKLDVDAPDLTKFSASPESLRLRLKDPKSVKSDTWMPDLNLSDDEIEALIAFINS